MIVLKDLELQEKFRGLCIRKAKADALPEEVRGRYKILYDQVCAGLYDCMTDFLAEMMLSSNGDTKDPLMQEAFEAIMARDEKRFKKLIDKCKEPEQLGFTTYYGPTPWDKQTTQN
ncbi:MAG TPA: hypothetical protein VN608_05570 [Clostridia bacterium]|nr:hypothetical protein [Clostridia bacterium]